MAYFWPIASQYCGVCNPTIYKIASATAIEKGEVVNLTNKLVVAMGTDGTDFDGPCLGVAAEDHDGSTADGRQTGTEIAIWDNPMQVFATTPRNVCTATGGSTTTFVDATGDGLGATDDMWIGGKLWIIAHAGESGYNGTKHNITDYAQASGTVTIGTTLSSALGAGDTAYLCPGPYYMRGEYAYDLNSDGTDINWEALGGESMVIVGADPENFIVSVRFRLHLNGCGISAL